MRTVAWIIKHILLPLTPFVIGAVVRSVYGGDFHIDTLSAAELSFSMAMMALIVSTKTAQIKDRHLSEALTSLYQIILIVYLALFAVTMFLETDVNTLLETLFLTAQNQLANGQQLVEKDLPERIVIFQDILVRLRILAISLSVFVIPLTIYAIRKYELEEL